MTIASTTIKVPRELRDRIAERARAEHVTLAAAISNALDLADGQAFWSAIVAEHSVMTKVERAAYRTDATLGDNVADPSDDALTVADEW